MQLPPEQQFPLGLHNPVALERPEHTVADGNGAVLTRLGRAEDVPTPCPARDGPLDPQGGAIEVGPLEGEQFRLADRRPGHNRTVLSRRKRFGR